MDIFEAHPELFHYTGKTGLAGILATQNLRATHYTYLNDRSELQLMRAELVARLFPFVKERALKIFREADLSKKKAIRKIGGVIPIARAETSRIVETFYRTAFEDTGSKPLAVPYITSFCAHTSDQEYERKNGLLSQWRGYAKGGYAIVFDTKLLCERYQEEGDRYYYASPGTFGDVVYQGDESAFEEEFGNSIEKIKDVFSNFTETGKWEIGEVFGDVVSMFTRLKHRGFFEEREVRSITFPMTNEIEEEYKRVDPTYVSPGKQMHEILERDDGALYIETLKPTGHHSELPIKRIIVGPQEDQDKAAAEIDRLVRRKIEVHRSKTPLVWPGT